MFSRDDFRQAILFSGIENQTQFKKEFAQEIETFIDKIYNIYVIYRRLDEGSDKSYRRAYTSLFLFNAMKSLTESFSIFLLGFRSAAGNLIRHYFESVAMAMLISNNNIDVFERYHKSTKQFPVHKSLQLLSRYVNKGKFELVEKEAYKAFMEAEQFYDEYSHTSGLALAEVFHFDMKGAVVIGGDFDPHKIEQYRKEIKRYISGVDALKNAIQGISQELS